MREIKFRAWDKEGNRWIPPNIFYVKGDSSIYEWTVTKPPTPVNRHKSVELMQYTGLKDKNGNEIYEGDFVRGSAWEGTVIFENGCFLVQQSNAEGQVEERFMLTEYSMVVIGNIYENPER